MGVTLSIVFASVGQVENMTALFKITHGNFDRQGFHDVFEDEKRFMLDDFNEYFQTFPDVSLG